jgi:hypothetical protein
VQQIKHAFEAKVSKHPWITIFLSAGTVLALTMMFDTNSRPARRSAIPGFKEGFIVAMSTSRLVDPAGDLQLRGSRVQLIHRDSENTVPCKTRHPPLAFSANERTMTLSGSLEEIDATILALSSEDLKHVSLVLPSDTSILPCTNSVKVVYGSEE